VLSRKGNMVPWCCWVSLSQDRYGIDAVDVDGEFRSLVTVRSPRICVRCRDPYLHVPDMYIV
jgi:hypothetical protein